MTRKQPDVIHIVRTEDGSPVVRWFRASTPTERKSWAARHPTATVLDVEEGKIPPPFSWSSPTQPNGRGVNEFLGEFQAWFTRQDETDASSLPVSVSSIRVTLVKGLTPTVLQRFPWSKMLTMADAEARSRPEATLTDADSEIGQAMRKAWPKDAPGLSRPHPGQRSHPDEFYKALAENYIELRTQGVANATAQLARELHYGRSTVAGWVRIARKKGYLPPARPGRAG